jgi:MYXO-CTERM domain-containing protein
MYNMSNNPNLDDELAEFTDRLFSGDAGEVSADNMIEARLVRQLHGMVRNNPQPSPAFRAQLTHRINDEWNAVNRQQSRQIITPRFNRSMAMAAVIVSALLFVVLLMNPNSIIGSPGMAGGGSNLIPVIFIAALLIVGALFLWIRRR